MKLPFIPADKANHFIYGQTVFMVVSMGCQLFFNLNANTSHWIAESVTIGVALLKEWYDRYQNKKAISKGLPPLYGVEPWDAAATGLGGLSVWVAVLTV